MKFTCDSCSAHYMISDEKVGPSGVKVRCKKCGTVIVVRRPAEAVASAVSAPAETAAAGGALEAELGQAFDNAFGDTPARTPAPSPAPAPDLAATQTMGEEDAARIAAGSAPAATEWYVAIGQAQVGPLPLAEVKRKWEGGEVGPDSLVWRPGMGDWAPLSTVSDLAGYLAPVPQAPARAARPDARVDAGPARGQPASVPAGDVSWKPVAASALAALASEEIATHGVPAQKADPRSTGGVQSLVDALPEGGGVDPTGAIPLPIKGLERTEEKKIERRSSVARGAEEARTRRSVSRAVAVGVTAVALFVAGGAAFVVWYMNRQLDRAPAVATAAPAPQPAAAQPVAVKEAVEPPPAAPATTPAPAGAPVPEGAVASATAQPAPADAAPAGGAPPPAAAPPSATQGASEKAVEPQRSPPPPRTVRREPPPRREPARETRVATATPPPAPAPEPTTPRKRSVLDFESNDPALDEALGGGSSSSRRSVYVPPRPGGEVPAKLSSAQINESVAQRIDGLQRCVSEQKARDADATGTLKMRWIIAGDGSVRDVKCLTPEYASGQFAQCLAGVVKTIKFPRSTSPGQEVTFPFKF